MPWAKVDVHTCSRLSQKLSDFNHLMLPSAFHVAAPQVAEKWLDVEVSSDFEPLELQTERRLKARSRIAWN